MLYTLAQMGAFILLAMLIIVFAVLSTFAVFGSRVNITPTEDAWKMNLDNPEVNP